MVFIPPGTFRMGSPDTEVDRDNREGPQTDVTISHGFWMGKYEVTQGDYLAVTGNNPSGFTGDLNRPVEGVFWPHAVTYCQTLTQREFLAGRIPPNSAYRLPTEAEWEYACRASTSTRFSYGDDPGEVISVVEVVGYTNLQNCAWSRGNSAGMTHPVGQKLPNPWGLYDMHGNVKEWCEDWFYVYTGGMAVDPRGVPASPFSGSFPIARGGSWWSLPSDCRSAARWTGRAIDQPDIYGIRVVLARQL